MKKSFGQFQKDKTEGLLRPVSFPSMALLDVTTGDGREIASSGAGVRELPRTIFAQFAQAAGHDGSIPVGTLQEVTFEDDGNVSGRGWLADIPAVRDTLVQLIAGKVLFHNSVDLAEVTYEYVWKSDDPDDPGFWEPDKILFTTANIAATTLVGVPAFPDARIQLDEVTAALVASDGMLEWDLDPDHFTYRIEARDEIMASLATSIDSTVSFDDFHMPEPNVATPHTVDADGRVYGHLAQWGKCHEGRDDVCVLAPRPRSYANFHANGGKVLTDKGLVETGPLFFLGGHPDAPLDVNEVHKAYGGIENAWADVRVSDGRFGPWYCGRVRPGLNAAGIYAGRASPVSGHWKRGEFQALVSVNVRGYTLPGTEIRADRGGASFDGDEVLDLVASFRAAPVVRDAAALIEAGLATPDQMRAAVASEIAKFVNTRNFTTTTEVGEITHVTTEVTYETGDTVALEHNEVDLETLKARMLLDELDDIDPH